MSSVATNINMGAGGGWLRWLVAAAFLAVLLVIAPVGADNNAEVGYDRITTEQWRTLSSDELRSAVADGVLSPNAKVGNFSLLAQSVLEGNKSHFRALMESGADVNMITRLAPLHVAAVYGREEMAEKLIQAGADVDSRDEWGNTPGRLAIGGVSNNFIDEEQGKRIISLLLDGGADINAVDGNGFGMLHDAIQMCSNDLVRALLEWGADANGPENQHKAISPLVAALMGYPRIIPVLVDFGADVNRESKVGIVPIQAAVLISSADSVRALLKFGADVNGKFGVSALQWAKLKSQGKMELERASLLETSAHISKDCEVPDVYGKVEWEGNGKKMVEMLVSRGVKGDIASPPPPTLLVEVKPFWTR